MGFDLNSAQPVLAPVDPLAQQPPAPQPPAFDLNSAQSLGMPNETIYSENTNEVIEAPHGTLERLKSIAGRSLDKGDAETDIGKMGYELFMGNDTPTIRAELDRLRKEAGGEIKTEGWIEEGTRASLQQIPMLKEVLTNSAKRGIQAAPYGGAAGLAIAGIGAVPGFFGGLGAGALSGAAEQTFVLETGHLYLEISEFKDAKGNLISPEIARLTAALGGAASAGLEMIPMVLLAKLVPGSKKLIGKIGEKAFKALKVPSGKTALLKFARNLTTIMAAETVTEGAQEATQIAAGELAKLASDLDIPATTSQKALERVGNSMVEALKATPLLAVGFSSPRLVADVVEGRAEKKKRPDTKVERVKDIPGELVDSITEKLRTAEIAPDLKSYTVPNLTETEVTVMADAGIVVKEDGSFIAEDAELVAAESMRRTDFYQKQLASQSKAADTAETKALRKVARGRIRKIDEVVSNLDQRIDDTLEAVSEREAQGKSVKRLNSRINSMLKKREILDEERANLLTAHTPLATTRAALKATDEIVELKGAELLKAERRVVAAEARATQKAFRAALVVGRKDVKAAQSAVIDVINKSNLPPELKGKFLAALKNVQTLAQLERAVPRIQARIDEMVSNVRRKKVIRKLIKTLAQTKVKGHKGKYGPDVQAVLDTAREALALPKDAAEIALAVRAGNGTTDIPTPIQSLENKLWALNVDPKSVDLNSLEDILQTVTQLIELGKTIRGNSILAKQQRSEALRTELLDLIGPERIETDKQRQRRETLTRVEVNTFLGMSGAWWNKIRRVMRSSDKTRVDEMMNTLSLYEESRAFDRGKESAVKRFTDLMLNAMNTTSERTLMKQLNSDETTLIGLGSFTHSDGVYRNLDIKTRAELRKRFMELKDPQLRESMLAKEGNAYTEDIIAAIENEMTEIDHRLVDAQLEFYAEYYDRINEVYERVYGYTLPKIEFYSPIKRDLEDNQVDEFMKGVLYRGGVAPGSLKSRKPNVRPIRPIGDLTVMQSHISEMEYFIAYGEKIQELNHVVGHRDVQTRINRVFGPDMLKTIKADLDFFSKRGVENSIAGEQFLQTMMRNFSFSQLGAKPQIGLKQLASFAAYAQDVKTTDFMAGIAAFAANPRKAMRELSQSELFANRGINIDQDYQAMLSDKSIFNFIGKNPTLAQVLMIPIRLGDKAAIAIGGYGHYHAMLKKNGGDKAAALRSFELMTARTQQSTDIDQLSQLQRTSSLIRVMTQFMSSANALTRAEYNAIVDKAAGRISNKEFAKRLIILHMVIPTTIQFIANGFTWDNDDQLRASIIGSFNGIFIFKDVIDGAVRMFSEDGKLYEMAGRHPMGFMTDVFRGLQDIAEDGISFEDFIEGTRAIDGMLDGVGGFFGVPAKTIYNELRGTAQLIDGLFRGRDDDVKSGAALMLGFSPFIVDEKILAP